MARYRIICTTQEPSTVPNDRAHIVAVGTGTSASTYDTYWQLAEVLKAMDNNDEFYTYGEASLKTAEVERYKCDKCSKIHLRSAPDAVKDNNLDNLPQCNVKG